MRTPLQRIEDMIADVSDLRAAIRLANGKGRAEQCDCGAVTTHKPCPRCRRLAEEINQEEKQHGRTK